MMRGGLFGIGLGVLLAGSVLPVDVHGAESDQPAGIVESPSSPPPIEPDYGIGNAAFRVDQARGLHGDKDAALRVAHMFREGSNGVPRDERRMVRWLMHASDLANGAASYQLYLHYLGRGLDREALWYENRALRQGFVPPPRIDPRRG